MHVQGPAIALMITLILANGCHSIHSSPVRDLIKKEEGRLEAAQRGLDVSRQEWEQLFKQWEESRGYLAESFRSLQSEETGIATKIYRNGGSEFREKDKNDVYAVIALAGTVVLQYEHLEEQISAQFESDSVAIGEAANRLVDSLEELRRIHSQIERYANKSLFSSVEPELYASMVDQVSESSDGIGRVLVKSRMVNQDLKHILGDAFARTTAGSLIMDLTNALDRTRLNSGK
jgi:hypothetical protein